MTFLTTNDAKRFLIQHIVRQAQLEGEPRSEIEQRMLGFSVDWPLEEQVEVNSAFEREYEAAEFEQQITGLAQRILQADPSLAKEWHEAIDALSGEDHYILVMVRPKPQSIHVDWRVALLVIALLIAWILWMWLYR